MAPIPIVAMVGRRIERDHSRMVSGMVVKTSLIRLLEC